MSFVQAKCPECGGMLAVDADKKAAVCQFCGEAFIVQEAINNYNTYNETINNYNTTHNYSAGTTVNVYEDKNKDFVVEAGVLKEYHGESVDVYLPENIKSIDLNCFAGQPIETINLGRNNIDNVFYSLDKCLKLRSVEVCSDNSMYTSQDGILYNKDKTDIIFIPRAYPRDNFTVNYQISKISYNIHNTLSSFSHLNYGDVDFMNLHCQDFKSIELAKRINLPYKITKHSFVDDKCEYCGNYDVLSEKVYKKSYQGTGIFKLTFIRNNKVLLTCDDISYLREYFWYSRYSGQYEHENENIVSEDFKTLIIGNLNKNNSNEPIGHVQYENIQRLINLCSTVERVRIDFPIYDYSSEIKREIPWCFFRFSKFVNLKEVIIKEGVSSTPTFENCSKLEKVKLPSTIKTISSHSFDNCINLKEINLPEHLEMVGGYAFNGCEKLVNIKIPENVIKKIQKDCKQKDYKDNLGWVVEYAFCDLWKKQNKCRRCGGEFKKTLLGKPYCKNCGKPKDY